MGDLLSASSLLMATVTILFSLWYGEIVSILGKPKSKHSADNVGLLKEVKRVLFSKAILLVLMSLSVSLTFAPNAWVIISESWKLFKEQGFPTLETYSAVNTAFSLVFFICVGLTIYTSVLSYKLVSRLQELK
ncbi:TPA: hypothetical protein ACGFXY_003465 [Vibrio cholerae]|uniref:hypothetical protein n=1 Tax=Vibrio cholerae TaxID=666 RepID=UPI0008422117|nr:hypothetical protein [Vibrio cholerae]EGR1071690.1 hypothetical protein [Vibrio cholerae]EGR2026095.1 hypothetical protein [Vibrio cholerae]MBJ6934073.1 hypothetical protein [Vibrio cholerae]MBO1367857.1 hypothetical protein [Vibrio cholerae]MBO1371618.1 hypothetical protein [Vibrio cholerae]